MPVEKIVAKTYDLEDGEMKQITIGERDILLIRMKGKFHVVGPTCPHYEAPLEEGVLNRGRIRCPWHQACFDAATGNLEEPPALDALSCFETRVEGEDVIVSLPDDAEMYRTMPMSRYKPDKDGRVFIIIGTGAAGNAAAETLRQDGFEGRIMMITRENHLPYDRPPLSKTYLADDSKSVSLLRSQEFYAEHNIEILTGREVTSVNAQAKQVALEDGAQLHYDKLLVASGGLAQRLPVPGADLERVFTLRSLDDASRIRSACQRASHVVVVGASFIGMETAASLVQRSLPVTVVALESVPFEQIFGQQIGRMYQEIHEKNGVSFRLNAKISGFKGKDRVQEVILEGGEIIETDLVLLGVGIRPATQFLRGIDLNPDGSVSVNENFQIVNDIYAAGDIASFADWRTGQKIRIEHWRLAQQHGRVAAHNMLGKKTPFRGIPFFWSSQWGVNIRYVGYASRWDEIIFQGDPATQDFVAFYVRQGKVLAASGCQNNAKMAAVAELMRINQMPSLDELREGDVDVVGKLKK